MQHESNIHNYSLLFKKAVRI